MVLRQYGQSIWALVMTGMLFMTLTLTAQIGHGEELYRFERVWPANQQPWRVDGAQHITVDREGHLYVADTAPDGVSAETTGLSSVIKKYTPEGAFITQWKTGPTTPNVVRSVAALTTNPGDFICIIDRSETTVGPGSNREFRFKVFTQRGVLVNEWELGGPAQFSYPVDMVIDREGFVYIFDKYFNSVVKLTDSGQVILSWQVNGAAQRSEPSGIGKDAAGRIYVADELGAVVRIYTSGGTPVDIIPELSDGPFPDEDNPRQRIRPVDVTVTPDGNIFTLTYNAEDLIGRVDRIAQHAPNLDFLLELEGRSTEERFVHGARSIVSDARGNVYASYAWGVIKLRPDGLYMLRYEALGGQTGRFLKPRSVSLTTTNDIVVADAQVKTPWNNRVQVLGPNGIFIRTWGMYGFSPGQFQDLMSVAVDRNDFVFTGEQVEGRLQKFDINGTSLAFEYFQSQGVATDTAGQLYAITMDGDLYKYTPTVSVLNQWHVGYGIAVDVDPLGRIYVAGTRINRFSPNAEFQIGIGSTSSGPGGFAGASGVAVDPQGEFVYGTDWGGSRVHKFTISGSHVTTFGGFGKEPGKLNLPEELAADAAGNVYVADMYNDRIQKFAPVDRIPDDRAVIVAAGGRLEQNAMWPHTQLCAHFAYRSLIYQGYTRDSIYMLDTTPIVDLDESGINDDVDAAPTRSAVQEALTSWASGAESLVVYVVGPGGEPGVWLNEEEVLTASDLAAWLDTAQESISGPVTVVLDFTRSGKLLPLLEKPNRIVITSTGPAESACFLSDAVLSFSQFFFTDIFNGYPVLDAFDTAVAAMGGDFRLQSPMISDSANLALAASTYIGQGTPIDNDAPVIGGVTEPLEVTGDTVIELEANPVTDPQRVSRVLAVIIPPGTLPNDANTSILGLPTVELFPALHNLERWRGTAGALSTNGDYKIGFYARDWDGNAAPPTVTTVTVRGNRVPTALIVTGHSESEPYRQMLGAVSDRAYRGLRKVGYDDDSIRYLSANVSDAVDAAANSSSVESALTAWAPSVSFDLLVYIAGDVSDGSIRLNSLESLPLTQLDAWLDRLQEALSTPLTVLLEGASSESAIEYLLPPSDKQRVVITSAAEGEPAAMLEGGDVSFSSYFWQEVAFSPSIGEAFYWTQRDLADLPVAVSPKLNDDGNGFVGSVSDGVNAWPVLLGKSVRTTSYIPAINQVVSETTLEGESEAPLWARAFSFAGPIDRVWAYIVPAASKDRDAIDAATSFTTIELPRKSGNLFESTYDGFATEGEYVITIIARDDQGGVSRPAITRVYQEGEEEPVEEEPLDINGDGVIDAVDVQLVTNAALGVPVPFDADVNNDGVVNATDIQLVTNAALGIT